MTEPEADAAPTRRGKPEPLNGVYTDGVNVTIRHTPILRDIGLIARQGEITALVGPNGSGKSTFLRALFNAVPNTGKVVLLGDDPADLSSRERVKRLAVLTQERDFTAGTRTREVVAVGRSARRRCLERLSAEDTGRIDAAMEQVGIIALAERDIATLSGGERQRAHIARVIAQDAKIIVMDEPTNHLDIGHQLAALELLRELAHGQGRTVLVALHDLSLAAQWADHTAVLLEGKVEACGPPREVLSPELIRRCFGVSSRWITVEGTSRLLIG